MTVRALGELIIWAGAICTALFAIGMLLRVAVVNPLKRNTNAELETVKANVQKVLTEVAPESGVRMSERLYGVELRLGAVENRISDHVITHSKN